MRKLYCPNKIEKIVQKHWYENKVFSVTENDTKEKYYCLSMIPYPSGNLHMGHVRNYTIGDVISRYQRMLGKNVLQPIGWDAFGLPAEQAAITNNIEPLIWTYKNIHYMKGQLQSLGFAYDWNRELITCDPKYYRWEQWFFTILYKKGLVYKKTTLINWCPYHKTVLANEQVINNCCWRCNTNIKYKKIPQWFIKITNYADELFYGLDKLTYWPKAVKIMQRNWIGRSEGINVFFKIANSDDVIKIYLTQLNVFMGITYLIISIDHPIALQAANTDLQIADFIKKNDAVHFSLNKNNVIFFKKRGIFTKMYAIHPINNDILPIWIVNFITRVDCNGTGSKASIPAHNQQDLEFARYYNLPIKPVIKNLDNVIPIIENKSIINQGILFNSGEFNGLTTNVASKVITTTLIQRGLAYYKIHYRLKDWGISRQRYWGVPIPMLTISNSGIVQPVPMDQLPVILPKNIYKNNTIIHSLKKNLEWTKSIYKGQLAIRETDTFDTFMESSWYYARYTCPHYHESMLNSYAANYWLPIDQYIGGIEHAIMHLMYFRFYHKLMRDAGLVNSDEPAVRLLCQGMVLSDAFYYLSNDGQRIWVSCDKINILHRDKAGNITKAIDIYGNNVIYAGMCKMSKSKNNGIDPNVVIKKYGADSVRFFIMFAAPPEATLEWQTSGLNGAYRFLQRIWSLVYHHIQSGPIYNIINTPILNEYQKTMRFYIHKTIVKVTDDIDRRQTFNTALAEIMKLVNKLIDFPQSNIQDRVILQEALSIIVRLLYPFTPHISFILWKFLGESKDIDNVSWPIVDKIALTYEKTLVIIQINGKIKHKILVPLNSSKNEIFKIVKKETILNKYLFEKKIKKIIYILNKVMNIVI